MNDYCKIYLPVFDYPTDTAATSKQVNARNATYECVCHQNCPKATK